MSDDSDRRLIDEVYTGDKAAYLKAVKEGHRNAVSWTDVEVASKVHPELELNTRQVIKATLGYLPEPDITLPYEPSIRSILHAHYSGSLTFEEMISGASAYVKLIRNQYIKEHTRPCHNRELYRQYFEDMTGQAEQAKTRLSRLLGYEPQLEHSLVVELHLRRLLCNDTYYFPETLTTTDIQAITVIKYREILLAQGKQAADASPLIAMKLITNYDS